MTRREAEAMRRVRMMMRTAKYLGWLTLVAAFVFAFTEPLLVAAWICAFVAAIGGASIGLGMWFEQTLRTWPVVREFIDEDRLPPDHESSN